MFSIEWGGGDSAMSGIHLAKPATGFLAIASTIAALHWVVPFGIQVHVIAWLLATRIF